MAYKLKTTNPHIESIRQCIKTIPDFPKPGILFRDITPLLADPENFAICIDILTKRYKDMSIDAILGLESRGFIFGAALAHHMQIPFIPVRKHGKLPQKTIKYKYNKEYGNDDVMEIHQDSLQKGQKIIIIDDLIATGGTAEAAIQLVSMAGAKTIEVACIIELKDLAGRNNLSAPLYTILEF